MSDQDAFSQQQTQDTSDAGTSTPDPWEDKLTEIVDEEGKPKYKSVEDALKALKHSQDFITTLKQEKSEEQKKLQELQAELEKRESVEDVVKRLTKRSEDEDQTQTMPKGDTLDESKVQQLVENMLKQQSAKQSAEQNLKQVNDALVERFGNSVTKVVTERAKELGTSPEQLKELSMQNPRMVLEFFAGVEVPDQTSTTSSQYVNRQQKETLEPPKPERSIMQGGLSYKDTMEYHRKMKEYTNKRLGVQT